MRCTSLTLLPKSSRVTARTWRCSDRRKTEAANGGNGRQRNPLPPSAAICRLWPPNLYDHRVDLVEHLLIRHRMSIGLHAECDRPAPPASPPPPPPPPLPPAF